MRVYEHFCEVEKSALGRFRVAQAARQWDLTSANCSGVRDETLTVTYRPLTDELLATTQKLD